MAMQKPKIANHVTAHRPGVAQSSTGDQNVQRYVVVGLLVVASFFGAFKYAQAQSIQSTGTGYAAGAAAGGTAALGAAGAGGGGGCCGGGGSQASVAGKATLSGGVQKITVDLTTGSYSPNQITAKAGVPMELNFKGPASGCNGYVVSQQLGFQQDVSNGGTVKIAALQPGTYKWTCSMGMYVGQIVVQ